MNHAKAIPFVPASVIPLKPDYSQHDASPSSLNRYNGSLSDNQIDQLLQQGFTRGLAKSLDEMKEVFALRIWIVDNSGSMQKTDGHRIISSKQQNVKMLPCSRWEEIVDCVDYHIRLAGLIEAPTRFRLLNNPGANVGSQQFSIAEDSVTSVPQQVQQACSIMRRARPGGCTPLTSHILEIHNEISRMAPELRMLGKKVVIVIATDGLPTDELGHGGAQHNQEFVDSLRLLEGLPVWVVVRLCTDDNSIVDFYNDLDSQLELSLEVLDDFTGEALEVSNEQPWLNYALPLHRLREFGFHDRVFDILDERPLTKTEIRDFFSFLFGKDSFDGIQDPNVDWDSFYDDMHRLLRVESLQYNPVTKKVSSWVNMDRLSRIHGKSSCGTCSIM
jgi:Mg-chelatase subunit ChlD